MLPRVLKLLKEVAPDLEFKWDVRDTVTARPPGTSRFWCRLKTKEADALECWFVGRRGHLNLSKVDGLGVDPAVEGDRTDGSELLKLRFTAADQLQPARLKAVLADHLRAFRATFGGSEPEKEAG